MQISFSDILNNLQSYASGAETSTKVFFEKLRKKKPKNLDRLIQNFHIEVFNEVDCLECANCCKSLGPRLTEKDIERLSKTLKLKPSQVVDQYLKIDEDNDYVFKSMPCPFLDAQNYCLAYESRPKACKEYPHTDQNKFIKVLKPTLKNTYTCPAAFQIVEKLKKIEKEIFR